jgi:hypothetical protein
MSRIRLFRIRPYTVHQIGFAITKSAKNIEKKPSLCCSNSLQDVAGRKQQFTITHPLSRFDPRRALGARGIIARLVAQPLD